MFFVNGKGRVGAFLVWKVESSTALETFSKSHVYDGGGVGFGGWLRIETLESCRVLLSSLFPHRYRIFSPQNSTPFDLREGKFYHGHGKLRV